MIRYVVIAVTMTCLVISTLTVMLWIRSYFWLDYRIWDNSTSCLFVHSQQGQLRCLVVHVPVGTEMSEPLTEAIFRETFALPSTPHLIPVEWTVQRKDLQEFRWDSFADGIRIVLPHWAIALVLAIAAVAPWVRRFQLRTLLLVVTVAALILGFAVCTE